MKKENMLDVSELFAKENLPPAVPVVFNGYRRDDVMQYLHWLEYELEERLRQIQVLHEEEIRELKKGIGEMELENKTYQECLDRIYQSMFKQIHSLMNYMERQKEREKQLRLCQQRLKLLEGSIHDAEKSEHI